MKYLKGIAVIMAALAVIYVGKHYFGQASLPPRPAMEAESVVEVDTIGLRQFSTRLEALGTASANESVTIIAPVSKRIRKILFEDGAQVQAGALLVQLENAEELAQLQEDRVDLEKERRNLARIKTLRQKNVVSMEELDNQQSSTQAAEARLAAAQARLKDLAITAPFAGVLGIRRVSPGALVNSGTVITTLDDLDLIKVDFTVPERRLGDIKIGQTIEARSVVWPGRVFIGQVAGIDSRVDSTTRAVTVQAHLPNPDHRLRPGMLLTVVLISRPREAVCVPEKALLAYADKQYVFVLAPDGTVERRELRLGEREAGWVEIEKGLKADEKVVVEGLMDLKDGARVRVAGEPAAPVARTSPTSSAVN